jgi:hypothetical protein
MPTIQFIGNQIIYTSKPIAFYISLLSQSITVRILIRVYLKKHYKVITGLFNF